MGTEVAWVLFALGVLGLAVFWRASSRQNSAQVSNANSDAAGKDAVPLNDEIVSIIDSLDDPSTTAKTFRAVFALLPQDRRDGLIEFYMKKHGCDSHEAMKFAILDRQNDEARYR